MKIVFYKCLLLSFVLLIQTVQAQVPDNINSGNPAFPFPQFLDYGPDRKTLASVNAPGVPHAEMEQRIRYAYKMMCNAIAYTGETVSGVRYMMQDTKNLTIGAGGDPCSCAEADGYYLQAAAFMGDKVTFDGLYMQMHDRSIHKVKRFIDGVINAPNYIYSTGSSGSGDKTSSTSTLGGAANGPGGAATDGDVDIALALLAAYSQWGEQSHIILNGNGWSNHEINYKEEARFFIGSLADTVFAKQDHEKRYLNSGVIGLDGYFKDGDKQSDLTDWFKNGISNYKGILWYDKAGPAKTTYVDYHAPAYMNEFAKWFEKEGYSPWCVNQFKRAEASADWLMGYHYSKSPKSIPYAGFVNVVDGSGNLDFTFTDMNPGGEDFRYGWRTITNFMWHGNPSSTWDPVTHEVIANKPNTFERDMGTRYGKFLKNQQGAPWNNPCRNIGDLKPKLTFKGPYTIVNGYLSDGTVAGAFPIPQTLGTGAPSAVVAQDFELMGEIFRHCASVWDQSNSVQYPTATYFHEWFKLLGMLVATGNYHAPLNMVQKPNIKVYHKMDKTFAFTGDQLTYTVSYRNYGSIDGAGTVVKFGIPAGFQYVSSTKGSLSGDSVVWNVGVAKGFKTGGLTATMDSMKVTVKVGPTASGRFCTSARVSCTNGLGWTSNEYPNNITAVMERNCVDVVKRALRIEKTASRKTVNPTTNGDVVYKIKFENSSDAGWINGGRPGVRLAFAHEDIATPTANAANVLKYRIFHDAAEPYIDYGNYRVSYFMNDPSIKCYTGTTGCTTGWSLQNTIAEGVVPANVKTIHENISPGTNADGSWNQRIVLQFSPQLATITQHLQQYAGSPNMVHEGGTAALRGVWRLFTSNYSNVDWTDDWSWDAAKKDGDGGIFYPIGDDYTNPNNIGLPIDSWHKSACQTTTQIMKKVLVEEWDGYTWRRIYGNGPLPGRDIDNVIVNDTLPAGVTLKNFIRQNPLGIMATTSTITGGRTVISWAIPKMQINQKDSIVYTATIAGPCAEKTIVNKAWIQGNSESPLSEGDSITVTCNPVTICPTATTLIKTSDKTVYTTGQTVKYTLNYTQTQGSIANPDLNSATDWTIQSGSGATFTGGKITLQGGSKVVTTHDYSYGTNTLGDGIEGTIQVAASEGDFEIVVRNDVYITIKPGGGTNPTTVNFYSGTSTSPLNGTPFSVPFSAASYDFRIKLNAATLSMWLVATGTEISGAASIVQTIPLKAGNAGVAHGIVGNNPYASHTITSWRTHMDVAFDVEVNDPLPTGITLPTNISTPNTSTPALIKWPLASGKANPMPYGTTRVLTWEGTFSTCGKVTNVAYINTRGITWNQYGVCYDINCGTAPLCVPPTSVTSNPSAAATCAGQRDTLKAIIVPGSNPVTGYRYVWYKSGIPPLPTNYTSVYADKIFTSVTAADAGTWILRVEDGTAGTLACYKEASVVLTVNTPPVTPVTTLTQPTCAIPTGTITITAPIEPGLTYSIDSTTFRTGTTFTGLVPDTYKVMVKNAAGCTAFANVTINAAPGAPEIPVYNITQPTCTIPTGSIMVTSPTGTGYVYSINGTNFQSGASFTGLAPNTYTVTVKNSATGCSSSSAAVINAVPAKPVSTLSANVNSYCSVPSGITLTASDAGTDASYEFFNGQARQGTASTSRTFDNATAGSWKVVVTNISGCSDSSARFTITKKSGPVARITSANPSSYCPSSNGIPVTAFNAGDGANYEWFKNTVSTGPPTTNTTLGGSTTGSYFVKVSLNGCDSISATVNVIQSSNQTLNILGDTTLCEGEKLFLLSGLPSYIVWTFPDKSEINMHDLVLNNPQAGFYKATYTEPGGCTGIDSVKVTVDPLPVAEIIPGPRTYCAGETGVNLEARDAGPFAAYEWLKGNLSIGSGIKLLNVAEGDYIVKVTNQSCSNNSAIVNVSQDSALTASISAPQKEYCQGDPGVTLSAITSATDPSYEWFRDGVSVNTASANNQLVNATAGLYKVKVTSGLCSGESDTVRIKASGLIFTNLEFDASTPTDTCLGSTLTIKAFGTLGTIEWTEDGVNKGVLPDYTFTLTQTTVITANLTTTLSCAIPQTTGPREITIKAVPAIAPSVNIERSEASVKNCEGENTRIFMSSKANAGTNPTFQWYVNGILKNGETNTLGLVLDNWTNATKVELEITKNKGCTPPGQKSVRSNLITLNGNANVNVDLQIVNINDNTVNGFICEGSEVNLEVITNVQSADITYFWRNNDPVNPMTQFADPVFKHEVKNDVTDTISVTVQGCYTGTTSATGFRTIKIETPISVKLTNTDNLGLYDQPVCEKDPNLFTLVSTGNIKSFKWYKNDVLLTNQENAAFIGDLINSDEIKVIAEPNSTCASTASDSAIITDVRKYPLSGFQNGAGPLTMCFGDNITLTPVETNTNYTYTWLKDSVAVSDIQDPLMVTGSGKYTLVIENGHCIADSSIQVTQTIVYVKANAEPMEFMPGEEVSLKSVVDPNQQLTFQWFPVEIMRSPTEQNTIATPLRNGFVKIQVKTADNCFAVDSIELKKKDKLFIPNAIVPGNNDQNSFWGITGTENYPNLDIKVFNRWGNLVYEQKGYSTPWDGTRNGKDLPTGTYYYVIKDNSFEKPLVGDITIVR